MDVEEDVSPSPMLEETFYILSKKNKVYRVRLSEKGLCLQKESNGNVKTENIALEDIIGCRCTRSKRFDQKCLWKSSSKKKKMEESESWDQTEISADLFIYAYILKKGKVKSGKKRERTVITLRFRSFDRYEENMKEAQKWKVTIKYYLHSFHEFAFPSCYFKPLDSKIIENKILVIINPKSGVGKGKEIFQSKVVPLLTEADLNYDIHLTTHCNDAREFVRTQNLWQYMGGVVCIGGDGILFEVINGIMERPDWELLFGELKLGVVPSGSGNGLAKSIAYTHNEPFDQNPVLVSSLNIVRGLSAPMDLVRVETKSQVMYSFLSIGWGLLSDVDIESERIRYCGHQRFAVWTVAKLICMKTFKATVSYLPAVDSPIAVTNFDDEVDATSILSGEERRDSFYSIGSHKSAFLSAVGSSYSSLTEETVRTFGPPSTLPSLSQPVPSNWVTVTGSFVLVHASYPSHLMIDCLFAPNAKLNDGCIWLCLVKGSISRAHLVQFLLGMSNGTHTNIPDVIFVPVSAFRLEPESNGSTLTVDGERVETSPIQAEILPSLANVFSRHKE